MANVSIYQSLLGPIKSIADYDAEYAKGQSNAFALQEAQNKQNLLKQTQADDAAVRSAYQGAGGERARVLQALERGGQFRAAEGLRKSMLDAEKARADIGETKSKTNAKDWDVASGKQKILGQSMHGLMQDPTPENARRVLQFNLQSQTLTPELYQAMLAELEKDPNPESIRQGATLMFRTALDADKQLPKLQTASYGGSISNEAVDPVTGRVTEMKSAPITQSADNAAAQATSVENSKRTAASSKYSADSTAGTARLGRDQSAYQFSERQKQSADQFNTTQANKPAATEGKPMTALQETKYRTQIAKDYQSANTILSNMEEVATSATSVKGSKGLSGATGLQAYFPSYPDSPAATAEVRLQNLEGKITTLGKAAASAAGAIGPMAVQEWKIVRDMIAAVEPKKGEKALLEQIGLIEESAKGAANRLRDAYDKHYSADFERYPQFKDIGGKAPETPKPGAKPAAKTKAGATVSNW